MTVPAQSMAWAALQTGRSAVARWGFQPSAGTAGSNCQLGLGHLHPIASICHLRLSSSKFGSWSSPFTLKFLTGSQPLQQRPALSFQSLQELCGSRDQAWPSPGARGWGWCHPYAELSGPVPTTSDLLRELPCRKGRQCPHSTEESLVYL